MNIKKIECKKKSKLKVLIASCIRQDPDVLNMFLKYLFKMDTSSLDVGYFFIDDNVNKDSSDILKDYANEYDNVNLFVNDEFVIDHVYKNHVWTLGLLEKIAYLKNKAIDYCIDNNYDYIFFIDSDIIAHQYLIKHLLSTKKDIVSTVLWSKWDGCEQEYPNAWLYDDIITNDINNIYDGAYNTSDSFLDALRVPGIYKVGYTGACYLISRKTLLKGINYTSIYNVNLIGEDRHFCIKAAVHDIDIFVDTNYPAYHIYNENDLTNLYNAENYGYTENEYLKNILSQYMYIRYNTDIQDFEKIFNELSFINDDNSQYIENNNYENNDDSFNNIDKSDESKNYYESYVDIEKNNEEGKSLNFLDYYIPDTDTEELFDISSKNMNNTIFSMLNSNINNENVDEDNIEKNSNNNSQLDQKSDENVENSDKAHKNIGILVNKTRPVYNKNKKNTIYSKFMSK